MGKRAGGDRKKAGTEESRKKTACTSDHDPPGDVLWDCCCHDVPNFVTISTASDDEVSQVSLERVLREMALSKRPSTPRPRSKALVRKGISRPLPVGSAPEPSLAMSISSEWPSDEEDDFFSSKHMKGEMPDDPPLDLCCLPDFFDVASQETETREGFESADSGSTLDRSSTSSRISSERGVLVGDINDLVLEAEDAADSRDPPASFSYRLA
jgi:hypothetical protein